MNSLSYKGVFGSKESMSPNATSTKSPPERRRSENGNKEARGREGRKGGKEEREQGMKALFAR